MPSSTNKHGQYMSIQLFLRSNLWLITTVRTIQYLPNPLELPLVVNSRDMRHVRVASLIATAYTLNANIEPQFWKCRPTWCVRTFTFFPFMTSTLTCGPGVWTELSQKSEKELIIWYLFKKTSLIIKSACGQRFLFEVDRMKIQSLTIAMSSSRASILMPHYMYIKNWKQ